jgi:hypothetical protein
MDLKDLNVLVKNKKLAEEQSNPIKRLINPFRNNQWEVDLYKDNDKKETPVK